MYEAIPYLAMFFKGVSHKIQLLHKMLPRNLWFSLLACWQLFDLSKIPSSSSHRYRVSQAINMLCWFINYTLFSLRLALFETVLHIEIILSRVCIILHYDEIIKAWPCNFYYLITTREMLMKLLFFYEANTSSKIKKIFGVTYVNLDFNQQFVTKSNSSVTIIRGK